MKTYFLLIKTLQTFLLTVSILMLATLPSVLIFYPDFLDISWLFFMAHCSLFFVMAVRPLRDLFPTVSFIRPLVILRKGVGVFSASIVVSFLLVKIITDASGFASTITSSDYWSLNNLALFAHAADFSAVLLLITSNNLSKRILGNNWKRIQRLSYVYFYGSGLYVVLVLQDYLVLLFMVIITILTSLAFVVNKKTHLSH